MNIKEIERQHVFEDLLPRFNRFNTARSLVNSVTLQPWCFCIFYRGTDLQIKQNVLKVDHLLLKGVSTGY